MSCGSVVERSELTALTRRSEARKRLVRRHLRLLGGDFAGTAGRRYEGLLDVYHGETGLRIDPAAAAALERAWREILRADPPPDYPAGAAYDKWQPLVLRELAAERMFDRFFAPAAGVPGVRVRADEVVVCPYSSTVLLEEAVATLARPGGVIVCPEGFYKSASIHVEKCGARIVTCPATVDDAFAIDPESLARCLAEHRARGGLCGVLLTLPGNPVVAHYSRRQMAAIARVLAAAEVPIICDMAFDRMLAAHIPIAAMAADTARGPVRLYDRVLTITGNSKGYNAVGPCKFGAACTGDTEWLARIRERLTVSFQRESTHLVRVLLENTPRTYFRHNRKIMREQLDRALDLLAGINHRAGAKLLRPLGSAQGMFLTVLLDPDLLVAAGVGSGAELEDLLLAGAGIDSVALDRTGSSRLGVRLNVLAPRKAPGYEDRGLLEELFDRLDELLRELVSGRGYAEILAARGLMPLNSSVAQ
ncbi:aminotransferase class I/II-fold pyridoxal phosphate-dependent enzyme [Nocardia terpenica]|uniref:aminotransferase class I/II-fold pyridoxal phosphate-dependent enzyme n=1 Tax=Nocardia terpenica TaxID=455432 RepID=UPI001892F5F0|nr:aminotransferase class I/II-fold pyridoxal phosphate-dependent enzyme [Nocardia terpenica]MBF6063648.1 aminotransferase class I/II-fold pyridoxal phosphate-dependent enzyme [Nocardia terpenica]MBF6107024.1 aminotransferase class I/II-fold pyridoxal phosphate-dependent enzyme [Nocardia terpenica]MBF6114197.1 aminotransferase class I/II-fold pyridoxal phosphate-dependent enzyme [Nocardia terpenica]MBF6121716.1 aminotransferase class I/II-fold pyridoxal phosphate-dependent enzyme [Nocardia terp